MNNKINMNLKTLKVKRRLLLAFLLLSNFCLINATKATTVIENLQVEYTKTPIGIDVKAPRFSWQMTVSAGVRNYHQKAYRVIVKDPADNIMWDTGKLPDDVSLGILYAGSAIKAATRYHWTVTVWDQTGTATSATSWFETGLMNPDSGLSAWDGATWIGGDDDDMVLHSQYLPLFMINYTMVIEEGSSKASFVLSANDSRLMDKNKNIFQVENVKNQSYFKVELDILGVDGSEKGKAKLNVYRAGYTDKDLANKPFKTFEISTAFINKNNKNKEHQFEIKGEFGKLSVMLDGNSILTINLNPMGSGHDYITLGMLCDIGFAVDAGQKASFSDVKVTNTRKPGNTLFQEDLSKSVYDGIYKSFISDANSGFSVKQGTYKLSGAGNGTFVVADPSHNAMPMMRTKFSIGNKKIEAARLYVTSRGIYEVYLNGKRVGDDYFNPGLTQYNITHLYQTYDVTNMVTNGQNALGAMLGEGWWSGLLSFGAIWNHFGDRQSLLAKLVITYKDGSKDVVITNDKDWKYYNNGPIVYSSLDMGEVYDATRDVDIKGWSTAVYDDRKWKKAIKVQLDGTAYMEGSTTISRNKEDFNFDKLSLIGQIGNNAGVYKTLAARSMKEVRKGVYVYNMGQNIVGVPKITISKGKAGEKITLRYGEVLYPDLKESGNNVGMLMTENYRAALSQDTYVMKDGVQVFQPRFTSHGFQYIEITGIKNPLPLEAVQGLSISSVKKLSANYETSNPKVNQLWSNLVWSNVDNFLTIPTDCPQRNERMGWSGDISIFSRTATYLSNTNQFMRRHMIAMRDLQTSKGKFTDIAPVGGGFGGLLWGSAGITVAWETYQQYNDIGLLEEHYNAMTAYMDYLATTIDNKTGISSDGQLGDWLGPQNNQLGPAYLTTAYHIFDLDIMIKVAEILNKKDDATKFRNMYKERKEFFNKTFVNAEKKTLGLTMGGSLDFGGSSADKIGYKLADTQTSYAVGLAVGAFNEENIPYMVKNLKAAIERENKDDEGVIRPKYSLMTGFIGTAWVSKALSDCGYSDLAYKILQNNQFPSWLYAVDQGATTIWERLNGYTVDKGFGGNNGMNSFNHYTFGAVGQWMMAYSLGIQRDEAGFKKFILQPEPDPTGQMTWAKGFYDSQYGRINSSWKVDNTILTYKATVPANSTATLYLPTSSAKTVKESGSAADKAKGITFIKYENKKAVYELTSGSYTFTAQQ